MTIQPLGIFPSRAFKRRKEEKRAHKSCCFNKAFPSKIITLLPGISAISHFSFLSGLDTLNSFSGPGREGRHHYFFFFSSFLGGGAAPLAAAAAAALGGGAAALVTPLAAGCASVASCPSAASPEGDEEAVVTTVTPMLLHVARICEHTAPILCAKGPARYESQIIKK